MRAHFAQCDTFIVSNILVRKGVGSNPTEANFFYTA